ncbi:protein-histidine N-methyltransferase [Microdochium nivale]|nr:protein-histidine N-methyltransferase [Microdochium nivale]
MSFSFSFGGDDIEGADQPALAAPAPPPPARGSAFPVAGKPLLPATHHDLPRMLAELPSKLVYGLLDIDLDGTGVIRLPRRELWDVRVQLMAEDDSEAALESGLGTHDVKTGVYEGGFKSWESSVDLVKTLASSRSLVSATDRASRVIELGCGTALPSLALFQWACSQRTGAEKSEFTIFLADYNPTVMQLVTLPNFLLCWALAERANSPLVEAALTSEDGELELSAEVLAAFQEFLRARKITLEFFSGGWSDEFVALLSSKDSEENSSVPNRDTIILGAETIYSPFALDSFTHTIFTLMGLEQKRGNNAEALVGAKRLYFGVGGSLDDFVAKSRNLGAHVEQVREETEGVRRGVVRVKLS